MTSVQRIVRVIAHAVVWGIYGGLYVLLYDGDELAELDRCYPGRFSHRRWR